MSDLRQALRVLARSPGFTVTAILSLALGIGANSAIFSLLNAVSLRTLAAPHPDRLAGLSTLNRNGAQGGLRYAEFEEIRAHQRSFSSLFVWEDGALRTLEVNGAPIPGTALLAGEGFSETMMLRPAVGRGIAPADGAVAVLGYQFWQRYFQGSPAALGKTIQVQGKPFTIVGVAPADFIRMEGTSPVDAIVPLTAFVPLDRLRADRGAAWSATGRLRDGVSIGRARAEMEALWPHVRPGLPFRIQVEPAAHGTGFNYPRMRFASPLRVLMAMVGLLLLLGSVNLATLLLARADARQRETGIRLALGASRARILRLYFTESLLLAAAGSLAGALAAQWIVRYLAQFVWTSNIERVPAVPVDGTVLAFTVAITILSGALFGLLPALGALRSDPAVSLRQGGAAFSGGSGRTGKLLVVVQVAVSLVLVVAATLFTGTLRNLRSVPLGFDSAHVVGMQLIDRPGGYRGMDPLVYYPRLYARLAGIPGVRAVSSASNPPLMPVLYNDETVSAGAATASAQMAYVAPGFFETMRIPRIAGRDFTFQDSPQAPRVAILGESLARTLFGSSAAVGRRVSLADPNGQQVLIAGVVRDSALGVLQKRNPMQLFLSSTQQGMMYPYVVVRTAGVPTGALVRQLHAQVEALGREYPVRTESIERVLARALVQERLMASLAGGFGVLALLLAAIGLYGLMYCSVVRRSHDIGIRMALGAGRRSILRMVLGESMALVAAGLALGAPAVYGGSKMVGALLYGVRPLDPAPLAIAAAVLLGAALVAAWLPARRAAALDPMAALRE